ncbi:MAG: hypothetical protein Q4G33_14860 [bacterium]|nr:hypothetical protein [bacterium]
MMILFDDEFIQRAALQEQYREGFAEGFAEGRAEVKSEAAITTEKTLREAGVSEEIIQRTINSILEQSA